MSGVGIFRRSRRPHRAPVRLHRDDGVRIDVHGGATPGEGGHRRRRQQGRPRRGAALHRGRGHCPQRGRRRRRGHRDGAALPHLLPAQPLAAPAEARGSRRRPAKPRRHPRRHSAQRPPALRRARRPRAARRRGQPPRGAAALRRGARHRPRLPRRPFRRHPRQQSRGACRRRGQPRGHQGHGLHRDRSATSVCPRSSWRTTPA